MRNFDFVWLVLLGWFVALLTILTNGWQFIFNNGFFQNIYPYLDSFLGPVLGSSISLSLATIGGLRSIQAARNKPTLWFLCWTVCVLAGLLVGLVVIVNVAVHLFVIGGPES